MTAWQILFIFIFCLILAWVEVQVEGNSGWAASLPTWRPRRGNWFVRWYKRMMHGKELTGYHLAIFSLVILVLHGFYFLNQNWRLSQELKVLSLFFLVSVVWDFLWFVINPHYGWHKFKPVYIAWHKSWLGPWPIDYYWGILISAVLFGVSESSFGFGFLSWLKILFALAILTTITIFLRLLIDKIRE